MDEHTALTTTTTTTAAANDPAWKQKRRYTPWIVLTVVLLGLAAFYSAVPSRRGNTMAIQQLSSSFGDTVYSVELGLDLKCNPSEQNDYGPNGCKNEDCAAPNWVDGCMACMCYNSHHNNPSWCDGTRNEYYDNYFDQHGENPWGDRNRANRKCNTFFGEEGSNCNHNWQCQKGICQVEIGFFDIKQYCTCDAVCIAIN